MSSNSRSLSAVVIAPIIAGVPEALLVIDFQNDFCPGGALAVPGGDEIAERLNELAASDRFAFVVATRDWHPPDHGSFVEQGGPWPPHCVQHTEGAELHPAFDRSKSHAVIYKGRDPSDEGYSGFEQTDLAHVAPGAQHRRRDRRRPGHRLLREAHGPRRAARGLRGDRGQRRGARGRASSPATRERALDELRAAGASVV